MGVKDLEKTIEKTKKQMLEAAKNLQFIEAAQYRDELLKLEEMRDGIQKKESSKK
jgi:excinuclease ABC subunit B